MEYQESGGSVIIKDAPAFSLQETFNCGQCFRWNEEGNKFTGIVYDKKIEVYKKGNNLIIDNTTLSEFKLIWFDYFDLGLDYEGIKKDLISVHPIMSETFEYGKGIRILQQEPWETLCSFIISQNNNIPRIKGIIERLCEAFGNKIDGGFTFPSAKILSGLSEEELSPIRSGFRAG